MDNNCKFAGGGYCLCGACRAMMEMVKELEGIDPKELFKNSESAQELFKEAENALNRVEEYEK